MLKWTSSSTRLIYTKTISNVDSYQEHIKARNMQSGQSTRTLSMMLMMIAPHVWKYEHKGLSCLSSTSRCHSWEAKTRVDKRFRQWYMRFAPNGKKQMLLGKLLNSIKGSISFIGPPHLFLGQAMCRKRTILFHPHLSGVSLGPWYVQRCQSGVEDYKASSSRRSIYAANMVPIRKLHYPWKKTFGIGKRYRPLQQGCTCLRWRGYAGWYVIQQCDAPRVPYFTYVHDTFKDIKPSTGAPGIRTPKHEKRDSKLFSGTPNSPGCSPGAIFPTSSMKLPICETIENFLLRRQERRWKHRHAQTTTKSSLVSTQGGGSLSREPFQTTLSLIRRNQCLLRENSI